MPYLKELQQAVEALMRTNNGASASDLIGNGQLQVNWHTPLIKDQRSDARSNVHRLDWENRMALQRKMKHEGRDHSWCPPRQAKDKRRHH